MLVDYDLKVNIIIVTSIAFLVLSSPDETALVMSEWPELMAEVIPCRAVMIWSSQ